MERSRSKRNYNYDQDCDSDVIAGTRPRYNHHYVTNNNRQRGSSGGGGVRLAKPQQDSSSSLMVTTCYRILCHDMKVGGVIGKSGSIIKSIRQHIGAWINVHELMPGDEERIIEISDTRRRDPEGRMPAFSPAQEALFLIHERILDSDGVGFADGGEEEEEYGGVVRGGGNRVVTRLVVSRMHVGCLLGKGGKIIEQMRIETMTQIRVLPRDHNLPRCVSMSEEIVQIVGDVNAAKNAVAIISYRLRESQHRDRSNFYGRLNSPERFFPPDDEYIPHINNTARRPPMDGGAFRSRLPANNIRGNYSLCASSFMNKPGSATMADNMQPIYGDDVVFQILCPIDKVDRIIGESNGIINLLHNEIGVDVKFTDPVAGSEEQIIIISSEEGPDDELFPAQEALLHIQTQIVDLIPDKDNIVTTRLVVPSSDIKCLDGREGSLSEMRRLTGTNIQILPRQEIPLCISGNDEVLQIVGEIKAAREALVEVTSKLRSYLYREFNEKDTTSASVSAAGALPLESSSTSSITPIDPPTYQNAQTLATSLGLKDADGASSERTKQNDGLNRISVPLVTRSTLEVVIPEYAVAKLITKSRNKLAQISELSGANITLVDDRLELMQKIIQISGTPEQAERAQSLLQGFILSIQEDGP